MIGERATPQIGVECEFPDTLGGSECLAEGGRTDVCTKDGELTKSVELEAGRKGVQVVPGFSEAIITQVGKQELRASLGAKANRAEGRLKGQREEKGAQRNLAEHRLRKWRLHRGRGARRATINPFSPRRQARKPEPQSSYVSGLCAANKVLTRLPGGCGVARPKTSCLEVSQASCDSTYSPRTSGYRGRAFRSHGVENMSRNHGWDCMLLNKSNKKHALLQCLGKVPKSSRVPVFLTFQPKDFNWYADSQMLDSAFVV